MSINTNNPQTVALAAPSSIYFVQGYGITNGTSITSNTLMLLQPTQQGSCITVQICWGANTSLLGNIAISNITDSGGNVYIQAPNAHVFDSTFFRNTDIWYCLNANPAQTITVTWAGTTGFGSVTAMEFAGIASFVSAAHLDQTTNAAPLGPSLTATAPSSLLIATCNSNTTGENAVTAPWVQGNGTAAGGTLGDCCAYYINAPLSAVQAAFSPTTSQTYVSSGAIFLSQGTPAPLIVSYDYGHWGHSARQNRLFTAFLKQGTTTVAAGNIVGAAAAASTQFAVWNPVNSGIWLVLQKLRIQFFSGTPTAGGLTLSTFNASTVSNGLATAGAVKNNNINGPSGSGLCLASAAGTTLTNGGALSTLCGLSWSSSATALASPAGIVYEQLFDGEVIIPPGVGVVPTWAGAGTTFLVGYTLVWEEVYF